MGQRPRWPGRAPGEPGHPRRWLQRGQGLDQRRNSRQSGPRLSRSSTTATRIRRSPQPCSRRTCRCSAARRPTRATKIPTSSLPARPSNYTNSVGAIIAKETGVKKMAALLIAWKSPSVRGISPPGRAGRSALWNQLCVHVEHRVRRPTTRRKYLSSPQAIQHHDAVHHHVLRGRTCGVGLCGAGVHTTPALERWHGRSGMAHDPCLQRQHRHTDRTTSGSSTIPQPVQRCMRPWTSCRAKKSTSGPNFGEIVLQSWSDGALLEAAVKAAGATSDAPLTSADILQGPLRLPAGETLGGLSPTLHFVKGAARKQQLLLRDGHQKRQVRSPPRRNNDLRATRESGNVADHSLRRSGSRRTWAGHDLLIRSAYLGK